MAEVSRFGGIFLDTPTAPAPAARSRFGGVYLDQPASAAPFSPPGRFASQMPPQGPPVTANNPNQAATQTEQLAIANDVSPAGAPMGARAAASFGAGQPEADIYRAALMRYYGAPVQVRTGPGTGALEFADPENSNAWTLVRGSGFLGDLASVAGTVPGMVTDTAGSIAGAGLGAFAGPAGMVVGGAAGAGVGSFMGELARMKAGQSMGVVPADMPIEDMLAEAGVQAAWGSGGALAGSTILSMAKRILGRGMPNIDPVEFESRLEAARQRLAPVGDEPMSSQVMADTPVGDELAARERQIAERMGPAGQAVRFRQGQQAAAGVDALNTAMPAGADALTVGRGIAGQIGADRLEQTAADAAMTTSLQDRAIAALQAAAPRGMSGVAAGPPIRDALETAREAMDQEAATIRFGPIRQQAAAIPVPLHNLVATAEDIQGVLNSRTFRSLAEADQRLVREALQRRVPEEVDAAGNVLRPAGVESVTYDTAEADISALRRAIRAAQNDPTATGEVRFLQEMRDAMLRDRLGALQSSGRTDLANQLADAEVWYREQMDLFQRSVVGRMLQRQDGQYKIVDEDLFDTFFKRENVTGAESLNQVLGQAAYADQREALRSAILNRWKQAVMNEDGTPNAAKNALFMRDYGDTIAPFLTPAERARMNNAVAFAHDVAVEQARQAEQLAAFQRSFEGRIQTTDPSEIFAKTWTGSVEDANRAYTIARRDPALLAEYRAAIGDDMRRSVMVRVNNQDYAEATALSEYLLRNDGRLRRWFGADHVNNLKALQEALALTQRSNPNIQEAGRSLLQVFGRVAVGPLSQEGRLLTAFQRIQQADTRRVLARALVDPETMQQLLRLRYVSPGSRAASQILGNLGLTSLNEGESE